MPPSPNERQSEHQARVDAIFKGVKSAKDQARDAVRTIARMGLNDPEALTLCEIEMICRAIIDQT